jgi:hypothetical protein
MTLRRSAGRVVTRHGYLLVGYGLRPNPPYESLG